MDGMEDPAPWQRGRDQFGPWGPHGPFGRRHRGPFWLRHRGNGGPLRRDTADRLAGGVASGVAAWRGVNVTTVRIVFVLIALVSGGFCVPFYVVGWLLIPAAGEDTNIGSRARSDSAGIALAAGLATLLALVLLVGGVIGAQLGTRFGTKLRGEQLRALLSLIVLAVAIKLLVDLTVRPSELYSLETIVE